jgi:hypothetical protein
VIEASIKLWPSKIDKLRTVAKTCYMVGQTSQNIWSGVIYDFIAFKNGSYHLFEMWAVLNYVTWSSLRSGYESFIFWDITLHSPFQVIWVLHPKIYNS